MTYHSLIIDMYVNSNNIQFAIPNIKHNNFYKTAHLVCKTIALRLCDTKIIQCCDVKYNIIMSYGEIYLKITICNKITTTIFNVKFITY